MWERNRCLYVSFAGHSPFCYWTFNAVAQKMEQFAKLDKVLAVFYEASRMYPTGYVLIREAIKDTELVISDSPGTPGGATVPVPKGMWVRACFTRAASFKT